MPRLDKPLLVEERSLSEVEVSQLPQDEEVRRHLLLQVEVRDCQSLEFKT